MEAVRTVSKEGKLNRQLNKQRTISVDYFSKTFDIINEEDEDIEEYEFPTELIKASDDERDRDKILEELESVTKQIVSINSRVKEEYNIQLEEMSTVQFDCQKVSLN